VELDDYQREPASTQCVAFMRELLPVGELEPERWVALNAHTIVAGTMFTYAYPEPELEAYVRRVEALLFDHSSHEALRRRWLSPQEQERVAREAAGEGGR